MKNKNVVVKFASMAHEDWRKNFDVVYASTGTVSKTRIKKNSDGTEGDINVPFEQLHEDWQKENLLAGNAAIEAFASLDISVDYMDQIEEAASYVHDRWMERNPKQDWNTSQHVPYSKLPENEKEKDRAQIITMIELIKEHTNETN